jgi:hypothetical protein
MPMCILFNDHTKKVRARGVTDEPRDLRELCPSTAWSQWSAAWPAASNGQSTDSGAQ